MNSVRDCKYSPWKTLDIDSATTCRLRSRSRHRLASLHFRHLKRRSSDQERSLESRLCPRLRKRSSPPSKPTACLSSIWSSTCYRASFMALLILAFKMQSRCLHALSQETESVIHNETTSCYTAYHHMLTSMWTYARKFLTLNSKPPPDRSSS